MKTSPFYYILCIDEEKSFSKAARLLGISQPALSSYVNKLEQKLGGAIFDRTMTPFRLTELGEVYIQYVRKSLILEHEYEQQLHDVNDLMTGSLVIGGANSFTIGYLPGATADFLTRHPDINIKIIDARVPELAELAQKGELDFFITGDGIDTTGLELKPLLKERIFMCLPQQWDINASLAKYRVPEEDIFDGSALEKDYNDIPLELIEDSPFILLEEDLRVRQIAEQLFMKHHFKPKQSILVGQIMTSLALTIAGNGISFISDCSFRYGNFSKIPAFYSFDRNISTRELTVAYKKDAYLSRACKEYIRILCERFNKGDKA